MPATRPPLLAALALFAAVGTFPQYAAGQDGTLDPTFGTAGKQRIFFDRAPDMHDLGGVISATPDGKVLVAGWAQATSGDSQPGTARLLPNGAPDTSYSLDGKATFSLHPTVTVSGPAAILERPSDGRTVIAGNVLLAGEGGLALATLTPAGLFDPTFGDAATPGRALFPSLPGGEVLGTTDAGLAADGKIVVCGYGVQDSSTDVDLYIARFTVDGDLDTTFATGGVRWISWDQGGDDQEVCAAIEIVPDGRIVALARVGDTGLWNDTGVIRLHSNGAFDTSLAGTGKVLWEVNDLFEDSADFPGDVAVEPDGRIVFAGRTTRAGDDTAVYFARLLADGQIDPELPVEHPFGLAWTNLFGVGVSLAVQSDRRIVVASADGVDCYVGRFLPDGSADGSFGQAGFTRVRGWGGADGVCSDIAIVGGRTILLGTTFAPGNFDFLVARLQSALIFRDGFASGNRWAWSSSAP